MNFNFLNRKPKVEMSKSQNNSRPLSKEGISKVFNNVQSKGLSKLLKEIQEEERKKNQK